MSNKRVFEAAQQHISEGSRACNEKLRPLALSLALLSLLTSQCPQPPGWKDILALHGGSAVWADGGVENSDVRMYSGVGDGQARAASSSWLNRCLACSGLAGLFARSFVLTKR